MKKIYLSVLFVLIWFANTSAQNISIPTDLPKPCLTKNQQVFNPSNEINFIFPKTKTIDSLILQHINLISTDSIISYITGLQNLGTRYAYAANRRHVAEWIKNKFISFGYPQAHLDSFLYQGGKQFNVIAPLYGNVNPDAIFILGGHHDAITNSNPMVFAPGADDNATAVATALEVARVMNVNGYQPSYTIQFMTFGAEEVGLVGSFDYAVKASYANKDIRMMINTDMTGNEPSYNNWRMNFQNYQGSEYVTSLGHFIAQNYSTITPVNVNSNAANSDSYPFYYFGYQTIFLQEYNFSPYYHSDNDIVANINGPYCAEIAKIACGMLVHAIETPAKVKGMQLLDAGTGTQILTKWVASVEPDVAHYKVFVGTTSGNYTASHTTTDTFFTISGLIENTKYYIGVAAIDSDDNQGLIVEKNLIPRSIPLAPSNLNDNSGNQNIKIGWKRNKELDLAGYNVYRSLQSGQGYTKINTTVITDSTFTDVAVQSHTNYYYIVKAIDISSNESEGSNEVKCRKISLDKGILIIDDSQGGLLSPTDEQVDMFYSNLLDNYEINHFDAIDSQRIVLSDLADYTALVWHSQNSQSSSMLYKRHAEVAKYLSAGGKILFTLDRPSRAFDFNTVNYPYNFNNQHFVYQYCGITYADKQSQARFIGATSNTSVLNDIYIDTLKTPAANLHHINTIEAIYPIDSTNILLQYDSYYGAGTSQGSMLGQPVGVKNFTGTYQTITLSFPLYYMQFEQAKNLVDSLLYKQMQIPLNSENPSTAFKNNKPLVHIYPNPVIDIASIEVISQADIIDNVAIYNTQSDRIALFPINESNNKKCNLQISLQQYKAGLYFCVVTTNKGSFASKFIVSTVK